MGIGRAVIGRALLRACRQAAIQRHFGSPGTTIPCLNAAKSVGLGSCESSASGLGGFAARNFSQAVQVKKKAAIKNELDDDPIMRMKFRTMDDDEMDPEQFNRLWKKVEASPTRALKIIHAWISRGNLVSKEALISICHKLCYIRRQIRALQIINWIVDDKPFTVTPRDYALQIKLTCRYASPIKAERIYDRVPAELKTEEVSTALIASMSRSNVMLKAEAWHTALKLNNARACNMMMILFLRRNRHREVLQLYQDLVASGGQPNPLTYLLLFKYRNRIGAIDGLEEAAEAALKKIDVHDEKVRNATRSDMMVVYAYLGKPDMVEKLWSMIHKESWTLAGRFVAAINAFGILGKISRAEDVLNQVLKTRKKAIQKPYCAMIGVYAKHGMMEKAELTMKKLRLELSFPWFAPFNHLVSGYLARDEPEKALEKLREGMEYVVDKRIEPDYEMVLGMMPVFASKRDVEGAEKLMSLFGLYGDAKLYNALLKVYVEAKVSPGPFFLGRMARNKVSDDDETKRLLEFEVTQ
ncbi:pentatricopeptide repeat-containing protein At1g07590, mitochondrial [Selaginella moellendorffii]|uniref:pentatricopeptide repeat-containing protein At1g07590, mitochondrial n=1 Tax=Selaginella moellendorffii TaxID=88036 RepID=UPI000D1CEDD0|nr:pentatricopeptide repeat-containing protein At1g07590, mitochondrial [Selaginella moellendorffii]|eukprot:XP_024543518.1 pentatricopeptide repeat-containing protein At1g07590, mitochondrial [Selaginella moellendorffii]